MDIIVIPNALTPNSFSFHNLPPQFSATEANYSNAVHIPRPVLLSPVSQDHSRSRSKDKRSSTASRKQSREKSGHLTWSGMSGELLSPDGAAAGGLGFSGSNSTNSSSSSKSRSQNRLSQLFANNNKQQDAKPVDLKSRLALIDESSMMPVPEIAFPAIAEKGMCSAFSQTKLEYHWSAIVDKREALSKRQSDQQEAIWELIETELNYIRKIHTLLEYYAVLLELQTEGYLADIDSDLVFGNIVEIYTSNIRFWQEAIEPVVQTARTSRTPFNPELLAQGFSNISRILLPYIRFSLLHESIVQYISRKTKESDGFREFTAWIETQKGCARLQFNALLIKPMQRLTKYPLLLKAIIKHTEDAKAYSTLGAMVDKTEAFLNCINYELSYKQHYDSLCAIMTTIESYEIVDASVELNKLVKQYSNLDLTTPMLGCHPRVLRSLFIAGDLKLREAYTKIDVHCLLFTDMFLICKQTSKKSNERNRQLKIVKQPFHIDRILIHELTETPGFAFVYFNEFGVASTAFCLVAAHTSEHRKWLECFKTAKEAYGIHRERADSYFGPSDIASIREFSNLMAEQLQLGEPIGSSAPAGIPALHSSSSAIGHMTNGHASSSQQHRSGRKVSSQSFEQAHHRRPQADSQPAVAPRRTSSDSKASQMRAAQQLLGSDASSSSSLQPPEANERFYRPMTEQSTADFNGNGQLPPGMSVEQLIERLQVDTEHAVITPQGSYSPFRRPRVPSPVYSFMGSCGRINWEDYFLANEAAVAPRGSPGHQHHHGTIPQSASTPFDLDRVDPFDIHENLRKVSENLLNGHNVPGPHVISEISPKGDLTVVTTDVEHRSPAGSRDHSPLAHRETVHRGDLLPNGGDVAKPRLALANAQGLSPRTEQRLLLQVANTPSAEVDLVSHFKELTSQTGSSVAMTHDSQNQSSGNGEHIERSVDPPLLSRHRELSPAARQEAQRYQFRRRLLANNAPVGATGHQLQRTAVMRNIVRRSKPPVVDPAMDKDEFLKLLNQRSLQSSEV